MCLSFSSHLFCLPASRLSLHASLYDTDSDHSFSQLSARAALACSEGQSAWNSVGAMSTPSRQLGSLNRDTCVLLVSNPQPPTVVGTGVLWVWTGTHPCDDLPKQDGEPSERQLLLACLLVL